MSLDEWLWEQRMLNHEFALATGFTRAMVTRLRKAEVLPRADTVAVVEKITKGAVRAADMVAAYQANRRRAA